MVLCTCWVIKESFRTCGKTFPTHHPAIHCYIISWRVYYVTCIPCDMNFSLLKIIMSLVFLLSLFDIKILFEIPLAEGCF